MPILKAFNGDQETQDENVFLAWPRRVSIALELVHGFEPVVGAPATAGPHLRIYRLRTPQ